MNLERPAISPRPARMRAAVIASPKTIRIDTIATPKPERGQVLIRMQGCGVCGSNGPSWEGRPWFEYPLKPGNPGHEGWGVVEEVGEGVTSVKPGDRVAALSSTAFAEFDVVNADSIVKLPSALDGVPFPGEALGCAMNIFRRSDIRAGQTVAIVGVGFLGALLTQLATNAGARVIALTRRPFALDIARRYGAAELIQTGDRNANVARVKELTDGRFCERVIEAVGMQEPLDLATELCAERGKLIVAGYHQDGPRNVNMWLWNWRGIDVINAHERDPKVYLEGIQLAADAVVSGKIDPQPLYTTFRMDRAQEAFRALTERPDGFVKALVVP